MLISRFFIALKILSQSNFFSFQTRKSIFYRTFSFSKISNVNIFNISFWKKVFFLGPGMYSTRSTQPKLSFLIYFFSSLWDLDFSYLRSFVKMYSEKFAKMHSLKFCWLVILSCTLCKLVNSVNNVTDCT